MRASRPEKYEDCKNFLHQSPIQLNLRKHHIFFFENISWACMDIIQFKYVLSPNYHDIHGFASLSLSVRSI